jgi:hypothetical protein
MKQVTLLLLLTWIAFAATQAQMVVNDQRTNSFLISKATIVVDDNDDIAIKKAASLLQQDIAAVTGVKPLLVSRLPETGDLILIGSLSRHAAIKKLVAQKKIATASVTGKWEAYLLQSFIHPDTKGHTLVISGSDTRGVMYGVSTLSLQLGVSPWYWWADVPVKSIPDAGILLNQQITDAPKVKYRGIFINDEAPALSGWVHATYGSFNKQFYSKVFELMVRLKSNYIWPAMWGRAFYDDDTLNIQAAEEYAIVIGTSHHEPMMRAHDEWRRVNGGKWDYTTNAQKLRQFWKTGLQRASNEKIVTVGMRGDGDEPMTEKTATELLQDIVKNQRKIIEEVTGKPAAQTPQLWALYKEVQDYYDQGMRVPDDVTLLLCDDNWGNIRKLPLPGAAPRKGGYGIYYHFDYVGDPRNYKWINTNPLPRVWEQMHLAWQHGVKDIWIVNVGDIKPMELPISFFLDYAWNPDRINQHQVKTYTTQWAARQFGAQYAGDISDMLALYAKYNARVKPELLDHKTYSLTTGEFTRVVDAYDSLLQKAVSINDKLQDEYRDAYFQLVLHPISAMANLYKMYYYVALNHKAAAENLLYANTHAEKVKALYIKDSLITLAYHRLKNGKWNHMMSQTHIGYTYWQQPEVNALPYVKYVDAATISEPPPLLELMSSSAKVPAGHNKNVYYEEEGTVSMDAARYSKAVNTPNIKWEILPDLGRTGDAVTIFPVTGHSIPLTAASPNLQYDFYTYSKAIVNVTAFLSPTLNYYNRPGGLQFAISVNNEKPLIISLNKEGRDAKTWERWVADNIIKKITQHQVTKAGKNTIKFWAIDPGVVLQKIELSFGEPHPSYLGHPSTLYTPGK